MRQELELEELIELVNNIYVSSRFQQIINIYSQTT